MNASILMASMCLMIGACNFTKSKVVDEVLVQNQHGTVFLQKADDGWFRTAHPFDLSPEVLTTVFQNIRVLTSSTDGTRAERVFSDEDTQFLSTLISTALYKASKNQVVGFCVMRNTDTRQEATGGILYIQRRLLHLTLTHYRALGEHWERRSPSGPLHNNPTRLNTRQIVFTPESARRSSRNEQPDIIATPPLASLVLDYEALVKESTLSHISVRSQPIHPEKASVLQRIVAPILSTDDALVSDYRQTPPADVSVAAPASVLKKEGELEALKEEVHRLQRRLSELESEIQRTQQP